VAEYVEGLDMEDEVEGAEAAEGADDQMIDVDFSTVGVIPVKGRYVASITSSKKTTSQAGNPMVVLGLILETEPYAGVYVRDNLMLSGSWMDKTKEAFEAAGVPPRTPAQAFIGRRVIVDITPQQSPGRGVQAQVQHYYKVQ